jgi:hypothetical protein
LPDEKRDVGHGFSKSSSELALLPLCGARFDWNVEYIYVEAEEYQSRQSIKNQADGILKLQGC